jgi:NADH-quinone oxidoreductase subunit L
MENSTILLIALLPLVGFLINGAVVPVIFRRFEGNSATVTGAIATLAVLGSFLLSAKLFFSLTGGEFFTQSLGTWLEFTNFNIPLTLRFDRLSAMMSLIITGVGSLIHLYSIGYMSHDSGVHKYFAYLNLFCFSMLLLVLGDSLPILFFGWEGVGLCSYLLIGFWYKDREKNEAANKAFIVNRIGDLGFLLGMFALYQNFGTLEISAINGAIALKTVVLSAGAATTICLLLFVGATGKSAQIPLFVWLPDAMSGPTPVSALIHAATMVTAGVYLICRLHPLFELSAAALQVISYVGVFTAIFAGSIAIFQNDIKKVLAYSTVSQLGFMFLACGLGAYTAAMFHLMTHAFFKALLFLCSGSVIHACDGEQDMRKMGGLKEKIPQTFILMFIGSLALAGVPIFAGFFSKDEILYSSLALENGSPILYLIGTITALLTAIYSGRMLAMTFFGNNRMSPADFSHVHESPMVMLAPLYVLAILSIVGGFFGLPHLLGDLVGHFPHQLNQYFSSILPVKELPATTYYFGIHEGALMVLASIIAIGGILFGLKKFQAFDSKKEVTGFGKILENKYYVDEFYQFLIVKPLQKCAKFALDLIDHKLIQSTIAGLGCGVSGVGEYFKKCKQVIFVHMV